MLWFFGNCIIVTIHDILMISIQTVSWLVAALVIVINGYLLLEFFSSEVSGAVFTTVVCAITAAYVAFIIYLISSSITFSPWQSLTRSKTVTTTESWAATNSSYHAKFSSQHYSSKSRSRTIIIAKEFNQYFCPILIEHTNAYYLYN